MTKIIPFDSRIIDTVIFDIDGTLYVKDIVYSKGNGSIQTAHDFFRFSAYDKLSKGDYYDIISKQLVRQYSDLIKKGSLADVVKSIPELLKNNYLRLVEKYGSNGKVFVGEFNTDSKFLHSMLKHINFTSILKEDVDLQNVFSYLKNKGKSLGILTTEVYETAKIISDALGFNLADFKMATGDKYDILCSENVKEKKPSLEAFLRLKEIYSPKNPRSIVYVGDNFGKDVEAAIKAGLQAIHVINAENSFVDYDVVTLGTTDVEYAKISSIYKLTELL